MSGGGGCHGAQQDVDFRTDVIELRVPQVCLSRPRWVQVSMLATGIRNGWTNFWDDPLRSDIDPTLGDTLSRKVFAG